MKVERNIAKIYQRTGLSKAYQFEQTKTLLVPVVLVIELPIPKLHMPWMLREHALDFPGMCECRMNSAKPCQSRSYPCPAEFLGLIIVQSIIECLCVPFCEEIFFCCIRFDATFSFQKHIIVFGRNKISLFCVLHD